VGKRNTREFCSPSCCRTFNNRKMIRGALLYDSVMTWRWDRGDGKEAAARTLLGQVASLFNAEDGRERDGRRSWDDLTRWKERNPRVAAKVIRVNIAGQRWT
jgi:hypothetical protein